MSIEVNLKSLDIPTSDSPLGDRPEVTIEEKIWAVILGFLILIAVVFFANKDQSLDTVQKTASILGNLGTLLLSFIASLGGLWWFAQREPLRPKLSIEQETVLLKAGESDMMLQVFLRLKNVGELTIAVNEWRLWACPLSPMPAPIKEQIMRFRVVADAEIEWEKCWGREIKLPEIRIRSGETQEMTATLMVKEGTKVVRLYSFIPNQHLNLRSRENRGWTKYAVVDLERREAQSAHR
jgi:hypothetical protein